MSSVAGWFYVALFFLLRLTTQTFRNGLVYWWRHALLPVQAIIRTPPVYPIRYYGRVLQFPYDRILADKYTAWCGITLRNECILSDLFASLITFSVVVGIFWYLGRVGRKTSEYEITGGRVLETDPRKVARLS